MVCPSVSELRFDSRRPSAAIGAGLLGRNRSRGMGEIGRTLLEKRRERFPGLAGAESLTELPPFQFGARFDLVDETLLEESLAGPQCAAGFCCELLRDFHCCREQLLVRYHAGHQAQFRRPRGTEGLPQQE